MIANYSRVQLLTGRYEAEGASKGNLGSVIEVYGNGDYEVEFADENGIDYAQIVAREEELQVVAAEPRTTQTFDDIVVNDTAEVTLPKGPSQRRKQSSLK